MWKCLNSELGDFLIVTHLQPSHALNDRAVMLDAYELAAAAFNEKECLELTNRKRAA
jgi:hypothetical protein